MLCLLQKVQMCRVSNTKCNTKDIDDFELDTEIIADYQIPVSSQVVAY